MSTESDSRVNNTPLSSRITLYRKKKSLTMSQLALEVGVSESYISFLESGARSPSRKLIKKLVAFFYPQGNPDLLDEWLILRGFAPVNTVKTEAKDNADIRSAHLSEQPDNLRFHFALIRDSIRKGDLTQAKEHIQNCLGHFRDSMEIQSLIGTLELAKGNYDQAIRAQELAIEMYPDTESRTLGLNDLHLSLGVSYFLKAYQLLGEYEQHEGQTKKSKTLKKSAQAVFQQAQNCFQQALQQDPDDIYTWDEYARVCFNLAHLAPSKESDALWQTTIQAYRQVLFHRDNRLIGSEALLETTVFLSMAYAKNKQFEQATEWLSLIQAIRPQHELPHYARACLIGLQSQYVPCDLSEALEHLARALQLASDRGSLAQAARHDADLQALRQALPKEFDTVLAGAR